MKDISNKLCVGDKVYFIPSDYTMYNREGINIHKDLKVGEIYTVKSVYLLCLELLEVKGLYLIENFRTILENKNE